MYVKAEASMFGLTVNYTKASGSITRLVTGVDLSHQEVGSTSAKSEII